MNFAGEILNPSFVTHFCEITGISFISVYCGDFPLCIYVVVYSSLTHSQLSGISNGISAVMSLISEPICSK